MRVEKTGDRPQFALHKTGSVPDLPADLGPLQPPTMALPRAVTDRRASGLLVIEWLDGSCSALSHAALRARCRCAACAQAARAGAPPAAAPSPTSVTLTEIRPVSDQGLNLVFSDGHGRGIYPWRYLRALGDEYAASPTICHA